MTVKVKIPTPLQRLTQGKEEVDGIIGTVIELVNYLDKQYSGIGERISENGKMRKYVNVYVNEEDIRFLDFENTKIKDGDEISIVPAIAGGKPMNELGKSKKLYCCNDLTKLVHDTRLNPEKYQSKEKQPYQLSFDFKE